MADLIMGASVVEIYSGSCEDNLARCYNYSSRQSIFIFGLLEDFYSVLCNVNIENLSWSNFFAVDCMELEASKFG